MPETAALHTAVERLAGRLRSLPQRRLQAGAAAEGLELARWLARQAQLLEFPGREPREVPDDGIFVVGDQLAVAGNELVRALGTGQGAGAGAGAEGDDAVPAGEVSGSGQAAAVLAEALERVARAAKAVG
ncbi:hypothetical protein [Streptomyces sp. NPDC020917]|uniref:hypothetical protein n=1 Tax=Streptomyces sp. NPDC020917 TaxID=3365102 RepID=UPI0037AC7FE1